MKLISIILLFALEVMSAINVCRYPTIPSPPLPVIREHVMPPSGPSGPSGPPGPSDPSDYPGHYASRCDFSSCSFSFYKSPYSDDTDCRCINPCDSKNCYGSQVCVVLRGTDNGYASGCVSKPDPSSCPSVHCPQPVCEYGYEMDSRGCATCQCKHPCKDFGCVRDSVCQLLKLSPQSEKLTPKCVVCPKLNKCAKIGVCKNGLKKDFVGCDVCECQGCDCENTTTTSNQNSFSEIGTTNFFDVDSQLKKVVETCGDMNCADSLQMDATSGCDVCRCEEIPCLYKCGPGEVCQKRYTDEGRMYGFCEPPRSSCSQNQCDVAKCPHGLQVDVDGCVLSDCSCKNPCDHYECPRNSYCQERICLPDTRCDTAYCSDCQDTQQCGNSCPNGRLFDSKGCATCQCKLEACMEDVLCKGLHCPFGKEKSETTGCEICLCASSPCDPSPCEARMACSVELSSSSYTAVCSTIINPPSACPVANCEGVVCPMGLEQDVNGCVSSACLCRDICKNSECPSGTECQVHNGCMDDNPNCRDRYMKTCVEISKIPTSVSTTPPRMATSDRRVEPTNPREPQGAGCPPTEYCASWCSEEIDTSNNCMVCNCPAEIDRCKNYKCPAGKECVMTSNDCTDLTNCRDAPMRECKDIVISPNSTQRPVCNLPVCNSPCSVINPSATSSTLCPYCECPTDCQTTQCGVGKVCKMVEQSNCFSNCAKIPRCIQERPAKCLLEKMDGDMCLEAPVKQWYYDHANKRCDILFYKGCNGNDNRFASLESCRSSCQETTFDCASITSCGLSCPHGFKLDVNDCKTCRCVELCDSSTCPSKNMDCTVTTLPCPSSQSPCRPTYVPSCACRKMESCDITCPNGKAKDNSGCLSCQCSNPCQNVKCGTMQLCVNAVHESCTASSCNTNVKAECVDAVLKMNVRIKVNASYDIYIQNDLNNYNQKLKGSLANHYKVQSKHVFLLKHEKGSIITTAEVLIDDEKDHTTFNSKSFDVDMGNMHFTASVLSQMKQVPPAQSSTSLSKGMIVLIVLLCILLPLALLLIAGVVFLICKRKSKSSSLSHKPLSSDPSSYDNSLPKPAPIVIKKPDASKEVNENGVTKEDRVKSFTEA